MLRIKEEGLKASPVPVPQAELINVGLVYPCSCVQEGIDQAMLGSVLLLRFFPQLDKGTKSDKSQCNEMIYKCSQHCYSFM